MVTAVQLGQFIQRISEQRRIVAVVMLNEQMERQLALIGVEALGVIMLAVDHRCSSFRAIR